jgi:hypothetical protein
MKEEETKEYIFLRKILFIYLFMFHLTIRPVPQSIKHEIQNN